MSQYSKISFIIVAVTAGFIAIALPAMAQTENNLTVDQPPPVTQGEPQNLVPPKAETNHAAHQKQKPHHAVPRKHQKKKKPAHKTAKAHKKPAKKTTASKNRKPKHKKKSSPKPHAKEVRHAAPAPIAAEREIKKPAPDASMAVVPAKKEIEPQAPSAASAGQPAKTVAYDFCLGYDNCIPHRYEATVQGGKASNPRVIQKDESGNWTDARLDPTMMSDLDKMARAEPGSRVERDLTAVEKSDIADHQGKMHATLVSDVEAGPEKKEEIKTLMRELRIENIKDLDAYDPRLSRHEIAVQAVNEIAVGR